MEPKKIGTNKAEVKPNVAHEVIGVMKPFVIFGAKALGLLATALIHIVKNVPKPHKDDKRVTKI